LLTKLHKSKSSTSGRQSIIDCGRLKLVLLFGCLLAQTLIQPQKAIGNYDAHGLQQNAVAEEILLPAPTGPYRVGRASFYRVDTSRPEPFTADTADHRQVIFHIWYPAGKTGGTVAPYIDVLPDNEIFRKSYSFVGMEQLVKTRSHAFIGVRVSGARKNYPVIIFSHGLGAVSALYATILENLASHGYIVVGVDSPFFSSAIRLPDGRIVKNESQRNRQPGAREDEAVVQAQDLVFVLNELERLNANDPDRRFTNRFNLRHVGVFGHSRGGFAAPHACLLDRRFGACLNLDGYRLTPAVMEKGIRQPYMHRRNCTVGASPYRRGIGES
jgi:pimeloyl-ACP methyl ester carboxylesterase